MLAQINSSTDKKLRGGVFCVKPVDETIKFMALLPCLDSNIRLLRSEIWFIILQVINSVIKEPHTQFSITDEFLR